LEKEEKNLFQQTLHPSPLAIGLAISSPRLALFPERRWPAISCSRALSPTSSAKSSSRAAKSSSRAAKSQIPPRPIYLLAPVELARAVVAAPWSRHRPLAPAQSPAAAMFWPPPWWSCAATPWPSCTGAPLPPPLGTA